MNCPRSCLVIVVRPLTLALALGATITSAAAPADLNPVTIKDQPAHAPLVLVEGGQPKAAIVVLPGADAGTAASLQGWIEKSTGAKLPIVPEPPAGPAIIIGDGAAAATVGLVSKNLPIDGFAIRTTPQHVLIVGRDEPLAGAARSQGTAWAVCEFAERFLGIRWYFPGELGQSIPRSDTLKIESVWLEDTPVFRKREIWPPVSHPSNGTGTQLQPLHSFLRMGNSWPHQLVVHSPNWEPIEDYRKNRPEVFQMRSDGTRDFSMLCYAHPRTLTTYLENIERSIAGQSPAYVGIVGDTITVSPADAEIACYAPESRQLWNADGGQYGSASKIVAKFAADLGREVQKRWPGKTVIYLPYLNYTLAPEGVQFPDNVEVQLCGMPGLAMYKEPEIFASEQKNIDAWRQLTGRKIQNWHYSCWPENRTKACYLFPHAAQKFYQANRDNTNGTFINGDTDHWPRQHVSLYCWMKLLWNPNFNVDAAVDEYCRRMYGPAAATMRELIGMQTSLWEESRFPSGRLSAKTIYEIAFPRDKVMRMETLLTQAIQQAAGDAPALARLDYYAEPLRAFFQESKDYAEGSGLRPLLAQVVGEHPQIDGKLDDTAWQRAEPVAFVRGWDKAQKQPTYPTTVQAVWSREGVTFGLRMTEPTPDRIERGIQGRDDSLAWWDDNVELILDVTGKNEGEFYHFIINANNALFDAKGSDASWSVQGLKSGVQIGKDFWSLEVYFPFSAFPESKIPGTGMGAGWTGNFTRHRVADRGLKPKVEPLPESQREYQRMNTTYAVPSTNLSDLAPIRFVE